MSRQLKRTEMGELEQQPPAPVVAMKVLYLPIERLRPHVRFMHEYGGPMLSTRIVHDFCLAMFRSARGTLTVDGKTYPIGPGRLMVMPPFRPHLIKLDAPVDPMHVAIHCDLAPDFPDNGVLPNRLPYEIRLTEGLALPCSCPLPADVDWYDELVKTAALYWGGTAQSMLQADAAVFRIIAAAVVDSPKYRNDKAHGDRGTAAVARVVNHLSEHLADPIDLPMLARLAAVSVPYLTRLFRTRLGYPPSVFLTRLRMIKARELLRDDRLSIKEISQMVGYPDPHFFAKVFRRFDGRTPSEYRTTAPPLNPPY